MPNALFSPLPVIIVYSISWAKKSMTDYCLDISTERMTRPQCIQEEIKEPSEFKLCHLFLIIGLITVFDAILTGRQSGQKLQCLYGKRPIANNFFQN